MQPDPDDFFIYLNNNSYSPGTVYKIKNVIYWGSDFWLLCQSIY